MSDCAFLKHHKVKPLLVKNFNEKIIDHPYKYIPIQYDRVLIAIGSKKVTNIFDRKTLSTISRINYVRIEEFFTKYIIPRIPTSYVYIFDVIVTPSNHFTFIDILTNANVTCSKKTWYENLNTLSTFKFDELDNVVVYNNKTNANTDKISTKIPYHVRELNTANEFLEEYYIEPQNLDFQKYIIVAQAQFKNKRPIIFKRKRIQSLDQIKQQHLILIKDFLKSELNYFNDNNNNNNDNNNNNSDDTDNANTDAGRDSFENVESDKLVELINQHIGEIQKYLKTIPEETSETVFLVADKNLNIFAYTKKAAIQCVSYVGNSKPEGLTWVNPSDEQHFKQIEYFTSAYIIRHNNKIDYYRGSIIHLNNIRVVHSIDFKLLNTKDINNAPEVKCKRTYQKINEAPVESLLTELSDRFTYGKNDSTKKQKFEVCLDILDRLATEYTMNDKVASSSSTEMCSDDEEI